MRDYCIYIQSSWYDTGLYGFNEQRYMGVENNIRWDIHGLLVAYLFGCVSGNRLYTLIIQPLDFGVFCLWMSKLRQAPPASCQWPSGADSAISWPPSYRPRNLVDVRKTRLRCLFRHSHGSTSSADSSILDPFRGPRGTRLPLHVHLV
jgi:hypothetical protein